MKKVVLYTRPNCSLCDDAAAELASLSVAFTKIDVTADIGLMEEFGARVPIIEVDGLEVFEGGISPEQIGDILLEAGVSTGL